MERAGADLRALGPDAVLVKGGHLAGEPVDVFISAAGVKRFGSARLADGLRGTGDLLACATAARLAHGDELEIAIERARDFVRASIASGVVFAGARTLP
jgi:hydroxymethylpyrimidine/phosphomethylpyrimidine kinase